MIPKKIHYCWFGGNPLPEDVKGYIASWRKYCPDYEIIEWNESNFDINCCAYVKEAYGAKKWAFVTDYVRLYALYHHGGIYMDTDVEVVKPLDELLKYSAFSGYESKTSIPTGTMGACRDNEWIKMLLDDYNDRHFVMSDGSYDQTTNVITITDLTIKKYGTFLNGEMQMFGDNIVMLPFDYLCAKSYKTGRIIKTDNTYTIHHFKGSWLSDDEKKKGSIRKKLVPVLGGTVAGLVAGLFFYFKTEGVNGVLRRIRGKIFIAYRNDI